MIAKEPKSIDIEEIKGAIGGLFLELYLAQKRIAQLEQILSSKKGPEGKDDPRSKS